MPDITFRFVTRPYRAGWNCPAKRHVDHAEPCKSCEMMAEEDEAGHRSRRRKGSLARVPG